MRRTALLLSMIAVAACQVSSPRGTDGSTMAAVGTPAPEPTCPSRTAAAPTHWTRVTVPGDASQSPLPYHVRSDGTSVVLTTSGGILTTSDDGAHFAQYGKGTAFVALEESHGRFIAQPFDTCCQGAGPLYQSVDHGSTWSQIGGSPEFNDYSAIAVGDDSALFVSMDDPVPKDGVPYTTYVSRDHGATWKTFDDVLPQGFQLSGLNGDYWARTMFATTDQQLFVAGTTQAPELPMLLRSSDGGSSFQAWTGSNVPNGCLIAGMWGAGQTFVLAMNCSIDDDIQQVSAIWYSSDGGATFSPSQIPMLPVLAQDDSVLFYLREVNGNAHGDILVAGDDGVLLYSNDGGATFAQIGAPTTTNDAITSAWVTDCGAFYALAGNTGSLYIGR